VGGKTRTNAAGEVLKAWDHDPPATEKLTPLGIVVLATSMLTLFFGSRETSDFWVDGLERWWALVCGQYAHVRQLVVYLDNGPNNSGTRTQFLKRMIEFADSAGLTIRLVYYPPYHSKYNPIERCWSALERKWNGVLLTDLKVVFQCALRMVWKGRHPTVKRLDGDYPDGVCIPRSVKAKRELEGRLERSATLPKYDIIIRPQGDRQVN
jgi:Rhodopirellula transposase DDE domain